MKIVAKDSILTFGTKSIAFEIKHKEDVAYVDYYDNTEFVYQLECPISKANNIYKTSIYEGYSESF